MAFVKSKGIVETAQEMSALEVTGIQRSMRLSDPELAELMGLAANGERRVREWKEGTKAPTGPAARLLKLYYNLDNALRVAESGDPMRALEIVRNAVPDALQ